MIPGGNDGGRRKPRVNVTRSLKDIIKDVEGLERSRRKDHEVTERVRWELCILENVLYQENSTPTPRPRRPKRMPEGPAPTAQDFHMQEMGNGGAVATFDNARQVKLSPALRELTDILAADEEESPDDLVAWKSLDRCCELLEKRLGREFDHHALSQRIWRLRESLKAAGLARDLVESEPALGARLRLKRRRPAALRAG